MYLFRDKEEIIVPIKCKLCMQEFKLSITAEAYQKITEFPIRKENIHGDPVHNLVVLLNKNLEIENFTIEEVLQKEVSYSKEITRQVLGELGLTDEEIELYFLTAGRYVVSVGEMSLLIDKTKEECQEIAQKFVQKGLFKEIIGATPHYTPLPPYAALVYQLKNFHKYISDIKVNVPDQLIRSFSKLEAEAEGVKKLRDYGVFMDGLKQKMFTQMTSQKEEFNKTISDIEKINNITDMIATLENDTKLIMDSQVKEIAKQFKDIQAKISQNLQKLRLGVVQQTVDQVVEKSLMDGLNKTTEKFSKEIIPKLKNLIEDILKSITIITTSSSTSAENIKEIFSDISESFSRAVIMSEEKISGISDTIFKSFVVLREIFSTKVIDTLNDVLSNILKRLETSEITTNEFWEQTKKVSLFTMKDIWFIRSVEAARAHITDELPNAKMRVLIVAPQITDIDLNSIKACPIHVNIRIAANIDLTLPDHLALIQELDQMHNVTYRYRDQQDLWGINKDYESVVVCVLSRTRIKEEEKIEIAGIGTIIPEHIKIFVPVLEEAWMSSRKEVARAIKPLSPISQPISASKQDQLTQSSPIPQDTKFISQSKPIPQKTQATAQSKPIPSPIQIPVQSQTATQPVLKPTGPKIVPQPKTLPQPSAFQTSSQEQTKVQMQSATSAEAPPKSGPPDRSSLKVECDLLLNNLDKMSGAEVASALEQLHNNIVEVKGYSSVLSQIQLAYSNLKNDPSFTPSDANHLKRKLDFWRQKFQI